MRVDEAIVISLPSRQDRLQRMIAKLPAPWPFPDLQVHPGVREDPPPWWKSAAGAWGCRQAHLQVLESAWRRGVESTLVLEDDAEFIPDFPHAWRDFAPRVPASWSMLMLGGQHVKEPLPGTWVRCIDTRRTHAYIIRLRAIPALMRTWSHAVRHIDHASSQFQQQAKVYAPPVFLVGQAAGRRDITGFDHPRARYWADIPA